MAPTPTLPVRHSGCITSAAVLPYPHSCHWGLAGVEGVPARGTSILHQHSTAVRDGISARCRRGRMEPHKGAKALHNEPIDSRKSSARVKSARRIRPGKGRRIGGQGRRYRGLMPHRVDGPSIAWGDREGARDPRWGEGVPDPRRLGGKLVSGVTSSLVGRVGFPGCWVPPCVTVLVFANAGYDSAFAQVCQANVRVWGGEFPPIPTPDSSRGIGMTGESGVGFGGRGWSDGRWEG